MESSKKTVAAQVRFVDVPGGVSSAQGIAKLREVDALAVVLRCFGADAAPADELETVRGELLLADLAVIDSALEKAEKKARGKPGPEVDALRRAKEALEAETPLRDASVTDDDAAHLRGIAPLTLKPEVDHREPGGRPGGSAGARGGRRRRRVRLDRGRDRGDGRRRSPRAARGVRRERTRPGDGDRGELPSDRPHHVPHHRRGRNARVGGAPRREGARGRRRDPHRPRARVHPRGGDRLRRAGRRRFAWMPRRPPASSGKKARTTRWPKATSSTSASRSSGQSDSTAPIALPSADGRARAPRRRNRSTADVRRSAIGRVELPVGLGPRDPTSLLRAS